MIHYTQGNLLDADVDALVNTVNTVGVMGKGIALMFKEAFPDNYRAYEAACRAGEVEMGRMFVTERDDLWGPRWIINFPTKRHWRNRTRLAWIEAGLEDLERVIRERAIQSVALPPLGTGNGGLAWHRVQPRIEAALGRLEGVEVWLYEPTPRYQNVTKRRGVEALTPARTLVTDLVRRYEALGLDCSLLEVQKLAWLLERGIARHGLDDPLDLRFEPNRYGPYADRLRHLLDRLDGSYLQCEKRLGDAGPSDTIWVDPQRIDRVQAYLTSAEARPYGPALDAVGGIIDGFESPLGMELLGTVGWLLTHGPAEPTVESVKHGLAAWPGGADAGARKQRLFNDHMIALAIERLGPATVPPAAS